jgi:hypothetical protein
MRAKKDAPAGTSNFLLAAIEERQKKVGRDNLFSGKNAEELSVGLRLPAFCLMYLLDTNVLPLGKIIGLAGPPQSQKSSLGDEIARWIISAGGIVQCVENEGGKFSPTLKRHIVGEGYDERYFIARASSLEEAQSHMSAHVKAYEGASDAEATSSLSGLLLDSMTGSDTDGMVEKQVKSGVAEPSVATLAKSWTTFLRSFSTRVAERPILTILINHLKTAIGPATFGPPPKYTPGGDAQRYHSSLYLYVKRIRSFTMDSIYQAGKAISQPTEVRRLVLKLDKSSLGADGRDIPVNFCWHYDATNTPHIRFDWPAATAELIASRQDEVGTLETSLGKLKELIDLEPVGGSAKDDGKEVLYASKALGVNGLSGTEIGALIDNNEEWIGKLCRFHHMRMQGVWTGKMPTLVKRGRAAKGDSEGPTDDLALSDTPDA